VMWPKHAATPHASARHDLPCWTMISREKASPHRNQGSQATQPNTQFVPLSSSAR
jgi:hypothetical protein